jgi:hypothetical protein
VAKLVEKIVLFGFKFRDILSTMMEEEPLSTFWTSKVREPWILTILDSSMNNSDTTLLMINWLKSSTPSEDMEAATSLGKSSIDTSSEKSKEEESDWHYQQSIYRSISNFS